MITKTSISWACACLAIGCSGSSSQQHAQAPHQPEPVAAESQEAPATAAEAPMPAETTPAPAAATRSAEPVPTQVQASDSATDAVIEQAGGAPVIGAASDMPNVAETNVMLLDGKTSVGTVTFEKSGSTVTIKGQFTGLKPGLHALFIHEKGDCSDKAKNVGGHLNPTAAKHGPPASAQRHAGDFGNLEVSKEGTATFEMTTDSLTLDASPDSVVGRALVIHARKDDGKAQPQGSAGAPIACGVIQMRNTAK